MNYCKKFSIVLLTALMFIFEMLIAPNFLIELHIDKPIFNVINSISTLFAAIAALCAVN